MALKRMISKTAGNIANTVTADIQYYDLEDLSPSQFQIRQGCRVTLYQDAHNEGDFPAMITKDDGNPDTSYVPGNCFEDIYTAILNAKRFIYITGWSVDTKISLLRRKPIFQEEGTDEMPPAGKMTVGELLKYKASQGVRVMLHVWDEALSVNIAGFQTAGVMCTFDEETKKYFHNTGVECNLSYRTGSTKDNQFLWTHHQKSIIIDAPALQGASAPAYASMAPQTSYMSLVSSQMASMSVNDYAKKSAGGARFVVGGFMTCEHTFAKIWDDNGSWCQPNNVAVFRPCPPPGWHILGDVAERSCGREPNRLTKVMVVQEPPAVPGEAPLLAAPVSYQCVWPLEKPFVSKSGPVVFWKPVAPQGYQALGYVATSSMTPPPTDLIRCVHQDALEPAHSVYEENHLPLWRNKGKIRSALGGPEMGIFNVVPCASGLVTGTFCVRGGYKLPANDSQEGDYWCLRRPPLGVEACPKPDSIGEPTKQSLHIAEPKKDVGRRRIIAFVGGLDLTYGRWDTPGHPLFKTLDAEHASDFLHGWGLKSCFGPREPWHDIHSRLEGPIARDVMTNFEQRWRKQGKTHLYHLGPEFISEQEEQIQELDTWCTRLCRSIDPFSADIPKVDNSIQHSYVEAIRKAKRFIYLENQYFMGGSKHWLHERDTGCVNLIPFEIADRIAKRLKEDPSNPVVAYILIPLYPEGFPLDSAIQEQLRWQWRTMEMMYRIVDTGIKAAGLCTFPIDYLKFLCVGQREDATFSTAQRADAPAKSRESLLFVSRRVPIYVHSKMMIIDDNYIILGSANINERSMAGDRDSEIAVECWQPGYSAAVRPRGDVHKFRMSLWAEHVGTSHPEFLEPNSMACSHLISEIGARNWDRFASDKVVNMHDSHLMRYPLRLEADGHIEPDPVHFPDTKAKVKGSSSLSMPDLLTC